MLKEENNEHMVKNGKTQNIALKAGAWYTVSAIVVKAISVVTTPLFTRIMSKEEFGMISNLTSWYSLLMPFCTLRVVYSIGRAKLDFKNQMDEYVGSMQLLAFFVTGIFAIVGILFINPLAEFMGLSPILIIWLIIYLFSSSPVTFMQAKYRYEYMYKQNIFIAWYIAIVTTVLSLFLLTVFEKDKVVARAVGIITPYALLGILYWLAGIKKKIIRYNKTYWKYGISISAPLIVHALSLSILSQSDRIFITRICGVEYTAIYSLVYTYAYLISVITSAVSDAWVPWFQDNYYAGNYESIKLNSKKLVVLGCYMGLASIAIAPEMIIIFGGNNYLEGLPCVTPIVLGAVCQYIYTHYVNIEMYMKKTKYISQGTILAAVLNFLLNFIFIPKYGYVAAAYTTMASYLVLMIVHYIITKYRLRVNLYNNIFMFSSLIITYIIAMGVEFVYDCRGLRYTLLIIGFVSFLYYFREFWSRKVKMPNWASKK